MRIGAQRHSAGTLVAASSAVEGQVMDVDSTQEQDIFRERFRTVSPEILARMATQRAAIHGAIHGLREASNRVPGLSSSVEQLEKAVIGHLALVEAVFEAIGDDTEPDADPAR